jgi:hypothetical protein
MKACNNETYTDRFASTDLFAVRVVTNFFLSMRSHLFHATGDNCLNYT